MKKCYMAGTSSMLGENEKCKKKTAKEETTW